MTDAEAHVQRFWNVDGLHEIAVAILFGLTAAWVWATDLSSLPRGWKAAFSITFPLLLWGGMWMEKRVIASLRLRLTYPRAGFVEFRRPTRSRRFLTGAVALLAAGAAAIVVLVWGLDWERWLVALAGLVCAIPCICVMWTTGLTRFLVVGMLAIAAGLTISISGTGFELGLVLFFAFAAGTLLVSGGLTLWRFLRTTPVAPLEDR